MDPKTKSYFSRFLLSGVLGCLILGLSTHVKGQTNLDNGKNAITRGSEGAGAVSIGTDTKLDGFTLICDYDFGTGEGSTVYDSTESMLKIDNYEITFIAITDYFNPYWF